VAIDRPQPQYAKAFFVLAVLMALTFLAFAILGFAIFQGLKMKKRQTVIGSPQPVQFVQLRLPAGQ
jgi:hypothetical protein